MRTVFATVLCLATLAHVASPARASAIHLVPIATGLESPVLVTHAGDGTHRLFIEEQAGRIRVLHPGSATSTVFLDIRSKVRVGGEQGLLGLAFHPRYARNGRFFVFYVRTIDQALTVAEYGVSASDPDVADASSEAILLTIPHPTFTNHNGGMLAFGPDGYLYIGVGDGGSGNDPDNNAQNIDVLLGKILRIDVDPPAGRYASPAGNPYFGAIPGRDEIFALGLRNPWRFSFDARGTAWVADVGQGAREEVNTPLVNGGNYGWRVYEGLSCTNVDPALCRTGGYVPPLFEYAHSGGRCSITGGYVYRGATRAIPDNTYVYGDYCTGEIFGWDGSSQRLLLDTNLNIASFGEDERGELYVVGLGGTVSRIASDRPCHYSLGSGGQAFGSRGGTGTVVLRWPVWCEGALMSNASWIHVPDRVAGVPAAGRRLAISFTVDANHGPSGRIGTIAVGHALFSVRQSGSRRGTVASAPP